MQYVNNCTIITEAGQLMNGVTLSVYDNGLAFNPNTGKAYRMGKQAFFSRRAAKEVLQKR